MNKKNLMILLTGLLLVHPVIAQLINPSLLHRRWDASWVTAENATPHDYGVYLFRKEFQLSSKPDSFIVHVSADNRYKLFVNGKWMSLGPARGDHYFWNFETVDLSSALLPGVNVVTAVVWNFGSYSPEAQISDQTSFILQGNGSAEQVLNTDTSWKATRDESYSPIPPLLVYSYYVAGPGEKKDMNLEPSNWMEKGFDDKSWKKAVPIFHGVPKGSFDFTEGWMLVPRPIPQVERTLQRLETVREATGIKTSGAFLKGNSPLRIPANAKVKLLLDQGFLTNGYPELVFDGGKDALISLSYAEGLYIIEKDQKDWRAQQQKGNRNEIANKRFVGVKDEIISNGSEGQTYSTLWWRTWRYMQLEIETKNEPLVIKDLYAYFTGYPFEMKARFDAGQDTLQKILQVGWRTARLCAVETYMDCPYYEQLQYVGDTRIQALVSLYNSGDDRLMRNAISQLDHSRMPEGITLSRFPTAHPQQIPPFSLWWIGMIHDYWIYRDDPAFVKSVLPGIHQVLNFFHRYQQEDGSLKDAPYWNFTDWSEGPGWRGGVAPIGKDGNSSPLDFQLMWAYQLASEMESELGLKELAKNYADAALQLQATVRKKYWDTGRQLFADVSDKSLFSQHANILAILTETIKGDSARNLCQKIMENSSLISATIYFKYYLYRALVKTGLGDGYLDLLDIWKKNLQMGMTTWAEMSDINRSRSDCHAWGSSPNIELYRIVLGIDSDGPGFKKIKIEPHLGKLKQASGSIPHPGGEIEVSYQFEGNKLNAVVSLPPGSSGRFIWNGKEKSLVAGRNQFQIE